MKKNLQNRVHETSVSEVLEPNGYSKRIGERNVALLMFARTASTRITDILYI